MLFWLVQGRKKNRIGMNETEKTVLYIFIFWDERFALFL